MNDQENNIVLESNPTPTLITSQPLISSTPQLTSSTEVPEDLIQPQDSLTSTPTATLEPLSQETPSSVVDEKEEKVVVEEPIIEATPTTLNKNNVVISQITAVQEAPSNVGVAVRVTEDDVNNYIKAVQYGKLGEKTTVCVCTLANGFEVIGWSACVQAANYNHEIGAKYALEMCKKKVWELLGFKLQCDVSCN